MKTLVESLKALICKQHSASMPGKISREILEKTPLKHLNTNSPYNLQFKMYVQAKLAINELKS